MRILLIQLLFKSLEEVKFPASSNDYNIRWSDIFAGMNLLLVMEGTIFLPMQILLIQLALFKSLEEVKFPASSNYYKVASLKVKEKLQGLYVFHNNLDC
jgi:hypothetical protein